MEFRSAIAEDMLNFNVRKTKTTPVDWKFDRMVEGFNRIRKDFLTEVVGD